VIERGHVCMLPNRARMTAAEFDALPIAKEERHSDGLPDFFVPVISAIDQARALIDGKWCLLTAQHHFGCKQVYAERITIVAASDPFKQKTDREIAEDVQRGREALR
jgi:hypothetical protein